MPQILNGWKGPQIVYAQSCGCDGEQKSIADEAERRQQRQKEFERSQWALALERAGLIGWLASATFDTYLVRDEWPNATQYKAGVLDYTDALLHNRLSNHPWLILHGQYGSGKSHLAAAIIREALSNGWGGCYFRVWPQYLKRLQASWDRRDDQAERTADIIEELQAGRLVVIDDLDKKQPSRSGWAEDELFAVLNHRYNNRIPTVLTFNHSPDDLYVTPDGRTTSKTALEVYFGRASVDRISGAAYDVIRFDGPSFRTGIEWSANDQKGGSK